MNTISLEFYYLVRDMRQAQRDYFDKANAHRKDHLLARAKALELQVDQYMHRLETEMDAFRASQRPLLP
jgi:hypothetical protein